MLVLTGLMQRRFLIAAVIVALLVTTFGFQHFLARVHESFPGSKQLHSARWWLRRASSEAQRIEDPKLQVELWYAIAERQLEAGDPSGFGETLKRLKEAAASLDGERRHIAVTFIADLLAQAGLVEEAIETVEWLDDREKRAFVCMRVVESLSESGYTEKALSTVEKLGLGGPAKSKVAAIIARSDLSAALEIIADVPAPDRDVHALQSLIHQASEQSDERAMDRLLRLALETSQQQKVSPFYRAQNLRNLAKWIADAEAMRIDQDLRTHTSRELRKIVDHPGKFEGNDIMPREQAAEGLIFLKEFDQVSKLVERLEKTGAPLNLKAELVTGLVNAGRFEDAVKLLDGDHALLLRIDAHVKAGRFEQARSAAETIESPESREKAWKTIAEELRRAGKLDAAVQAIGETSSETIENWERVGYLIALARDQAESGDRKTALQTLREASRLAVRSQSEAQVAIAVARLGDFERAREIAERVESDLGRSAVFRRIAGEQLKAGDRAGFRRSIQDAINAVAKTSSRDGEHVSNYSQIAMLYHRAGMQGPFRSTLQSAFLQAVRVESPFWKMASFGSIAATLYEAREMDTWPRLVAHLRLPQDRAIASMVAGMVLLQSPELKENRMSQHSTERAIEHFPSDVSSLTAKPPHLFARSRSTLCRMPPWR